MDEEPNDGELVIIGKDDQGRDPWEIRDGILEKWIRQDGRYKRFPKEWSIEKSTIQLAIRSRVRIIKINNLKKALIYHVSIEDFLSYGRDDIRYSREVICLGLDFWRIESIASPGQYYEQLKFI